MQTYLDSENLSVQLPGLVCRDASRDNRSTDTTGSTKRSLGGHEDVRNVLVFTEKRQVEDNFDRFDIGRHDDEFANSSIECLCRFVGTACHQLGLGKGSDRI